MNLRHRSGTYMQRPDPSLPPSARLLVYSNLRVLRVLRVKKWRPGKGTLAWGAPPAGGAQAWSSHRGRGGLHAQHISAARARRAVRRPQHYVNVYVPSHPP
eukprot:12978-Chlamydomonas_euryale.AAC.2